MMREDEIRNLVIARPTDLMDFHLRWSQFRNEASEVQKIETLSSQQQEIIGWLIAMADRISEVDVD